MSSRDGYATIDGLEYEHETDQAVKYAWRAHPKSPTRVLWIPKSVIWGDDYDTDEIEVQEWYAIKEGLV